MDVLISRKVKKQGEQHADDLSGHRCHSGTGYLHPGKSEQAEDQDRIHNDVDDGSQSLGDHVVDRASRGLQQPFTGDREKQADGKGAADEQIIPAVLDDLRIGDLRGKIKFREKDTENGEGQTA